MMTVAWRDVRVGDAWRCVRDARRVRSTQDTPRGEAEEHEQCSNEVIPKTANVVWMRVCSIVFSRNRPLEHDRGLKTRETENI